MTQPPMSGRCRRKFNVDVPAAAHNWMAFMRNVVPELQRRG